MNRAISGFLLLLLGGVLVTQAQAQTGPGEQPSLQLAARAQWVAQNTPLNNAPPASNPIRRINPNSRQGTGDSVPGARGPSIAPLQRKPTLENGQIGNGYPRNQPPAQLLKPTAPSLQPRDTPY